MRGGDGACGLGLGGLDGRGFYFYELMRNGRVLSGIDYVLVQKGLSLSIYSISNAKYVALHRSSRCSLSAKHPNKGLRMKMLPSVRHIIVHLVNTVPPKHLNGMQNAVPGYWK